MASYSSVRGLYVHVPFCLARCPYCAFSTGLYGKAEADRYLAAMDREMAWIPREFRPVTIFVGGGTPTALSEAQFARLLSQVRGRVDCSQVVEWTVEANPGTLSPAKVAVMRDAGVTRASVGVQSFDDRLLRGLLGRIHDVAQAEGAVARVLAAGLDASLDLIYGIPGQTQAGLRRDVGRATDLGVHHVSAYSLTYEEGTPLAASGVSPMDEDMEAGIYADLVETLDAAGYSRYEISNFARPGKECRHNLNYWERGEYRGVGAAAHSFVAGLRFANVWDSADYIGRVEAGLSPREFAERIGARSAAGEAMFLGLRLDRGVLPGTGDLFAGTLARLKAQGVVVEAGGRLRLARDRFFVSDAVFAEFV